MLNLKDFIFVEKMTKRPSLMFCFIDDFTNEMIMGDIKLKLWSDTGHIKSDEDEKKPVRNVSGHYLFFSLAPGDYRYSIESDYYDKVDDGITVVEDVFADKPAIVHLIPLPSYPFSNGATILRGTALEKGSNGPVKGASVELKIKGDVKRAVTTEKGEFVIYLPRLKENMLKKANGTYFVKGDNDTTELAPLFTRDGYVYVDNKIILIKDGGEEEIDTFSLGAGKTAIIKKYLKKGG